MAKLQNALVVAEAVLAVLLMAGVLIQTPKASGLGGTIGGGEPRGELASAIGQAFGSFEEMKDRMSKAAVGQFGSGWAWLYVKDGKLAIGSTPGHDTPLQDGGKPILVVDVWEHAYYLKYQNRRPDYVGAWWNLVDWAKVEDERRAAVR